MVMSEMMEEIVNHYYKDNAKKLRETVDKILKRFYSLNKEDCYSIADEVFYNTLVKGKYETTNAFDGFLYVGLTNKFKDELTKQVRKKKYIQNDFLPIDEDMEINDGMYFVRNNLMSDYNLEEEVIDKLDKEKNEKINCYLNQLSIKQKKILYLLLDGYSGADIMKKLKLKRREYDDNLSGMRSFEKTIVFFEI